MNMNTNIYTEIVSIRDDLKVVNSIPLKELIETNNHILRLGSNNSEKEIKFLKSLNDYYAKLLFCLYHYINNDKFEWTIKLYNNEGKSISSNDYSYEYYIIKLNNCNFPREFKSIICNTNDITISNIVLNRTLKSLYNLTTLNDVIEEELNNKMHFMCHCSKERFINTVITLACKTVIITQYDAIKIIIFLIDSIETNRTIIEKSF